jgi:hypothetical protein
LPVPDHADGAGAVNGNADGDANSDRTAEVWNESDEFLVARGDQSIFMFDSMIYMMQFCI